MSATPACIVWVIVTTAVTQTAMAATFDAPPKGEDVIGEPQYLKAQHQDTLVDLARLYNVGLNELQAANPRVDTWLPGAGSVVVIPARYILPQTKHQGIVINVPEMRLYYYPKNKREERPRVVTYPISVGRRNWQTPKGLTQIVRKVRDPTWYPPESIRKEHAEDGNPLEKVIPPGPDNPLGGYALRLGIPKYLIHGTNKPNGIGMQVTHGCVRLFPEDIEALFNSVSTGTQVRIVNQPYKVGWRGAELYLEVHAPLHEGDEGQVGLEAVTDLIAWTVEGQGATEVDWKGVKSILQAADGIPWPIGRRVRVELARGDNPQHPGPPTSMDSETAQELYLDTY